VFSGRQAQKEQTVQVRAAEERGPGEPRRLRAGVLPAEPRQLLSENNAVQRIPEQSQ